MENSITINWKTVVALGASVVGVVFAIKMSPEAAERVSIHAIDACKEMALAKSER